MALDDASPPWSREMDDSENPSVPDTRNGFTATPGSGRRNPNDSDGTSVAICGGVAHDTRTADGQRKAPRMAETMGDRLATHEAIGAVQLLSARLLSDVAAERISLDALARAEYKARAEAKREALK